MPHHHQDIEDDVTSQDSETTLFTTEEEKQLLGGPSLPLRRRARRWPWIASTTLLAIICVTQFLLLMLLVHPKRGFEHGFETESSAAASHIDVEIVQFTGGLVYDDNGTLYRAVDHSQPQYVGSPGPALDAAWRDLIHHRYVSFVDDQADKEIRDEAWHNPDTGVYEAGADVLHTLHCINRLRQNLDPDYYAAGLASDEPLENRRLHNDHCLDYLRQYVQCHGDLTMLPVYWSVGAQRAVPDFDRPHTCRKFSKLRDWASEQNADARRRGSERQKQLEHHKVEIV